MNNITCYRVEGQNLNEQDYKSIAVVSLSVFIITASICFAWMFGLI